VVILGGGYTGLWTAWFLTERDPGLSVVVLEQDVCGGGPSGRNGGFVTGWWDDLPDLADLHGIEGAFDAAREVGDSVRAIGTWCEEQGVDAHYRRAGYLTVATAPAQDDAWTGAVDLCRRLGVPEAYVPLSAEEVANRFASPVVRGGVLMADGATVQPALLARGLRRVLLGRGVRIHESSPVTRFRPGPPAEAETPTGTIRAPRAVIALNAWAAAWPRFRRRLVTWGSYIVLTAPAPDRLAEMGWTGGECVTDARSALHYLRTTEDGRVAFGGGGGRAAIGGGIGPRFAYDPPSVRRALHGLRRLLPALDAVPVEEAWGGPIDVSPTHFPYFGTLPSGNVHFGHGYSGNGVAPAHLAGRILSGLALDGTDAATRLPMVQTDPRPFPPEPIRTIGTHLIREATVRLDRAEDEARQPGPVTGFVARLPRRLGFRWGPH
jgi:glycine/D-amino acid oxidase-like deaminating enzyme